MSVTTQSATNGLSWQERLAIGKAQRKRVPRSSHADWKPASDRPDVVATLEATSLGRMPELVPIRYGRMLRSPLAFLRGSAAAMAFDLAHTPITDIRVQLCGDCHLLNFGGFGTPERALNFDVADFDETLPGPWEWDVKRLAASFVVAARVRGFADRIANDAALAICRAYRERMRMFSQMRVLEVWYARIDAQTLLAMARAPGSRQIHDAAPAPPQAHAREHVFPKMTALVDGQRRIVDNPPLIFHPAAGEQFERDLPSFFQRYCQTLLDERRLLLARFQRVDVAMKVVGVGSVGTRCAVILLMADQTDPLFLQVKEALPSVLEPFAGKSQYRNQGQRVVCGQRLLQSVSDILLGWASDDHGHDFYFRQLRDMKISARIEASSVSELIGYAELCGWALARAHAKSSDPALISGYLGNNDPFDLAIAQFATSYADQTESDHKAMVKAVQSGRLVAQSG